MVTMQQHCGVSTIHTDTLESIESLKPVVDPNQPPAEVVTGTKRDLCNLVESTSTFCTQIFQITVEVLLRNYTVIYRKRERGGEREEKRKVLIHYWYNVAKEI